MNFFKAGVLLVAVSMISGCSEDMRSRISGLLERVRPTQAKVKSEPGRELLAQLVSLDAIGLNMAYVEKMAGPPMRSESHQHQFQVQGCSLVLGSDEEDKSIQSVQVAVTPGCDVDVSGILGLQTPQPLGSLTFGHFDKATASGQYLADCLKDCGNAYLPNIYLVTGGSRALQFKEVMVAVPLAADAVLKAKDQWIDAMARAETEDWISVDQGFNCRPQKYRGAAAQALRTIQPSFLSFGNQLEYPRCVSVQPEDAQEPSAAAPSGAATVAVPRPEGKCDMEYHKRVEAAGLVAKEISIHGPDDRDFVGYGCAYRITPMPGSQIPSGSTVTYRGAWEAS